jgi:hypothetical protein
MTAAPGAPGLPPTWCSSAQGMVGCSLGLHVLEIDTARLRAGRYSDLTFRSGANWIGTDFRILVTARARQPG